MDEGVRTLLISLLWLMAAEPDRIAEGTAVTSGKGERVEVTKQPVLVWFAKDCAEKPPFPASIRVIALADCQEAWRDSSGVLAKAAAGATALLIDGGRIVARIPAERFAAYGPELAAWAEGRLIYEAQCARCHGPEGDATHFEGIKPVKGIGKRISRTEIVERTVRSGNVDMNRYTAAERNAIAVFVSSL